VKVNQKEKRSAIEKTLEILIAFADSDRELGTVEISELTYLHRATVSRILRTLLDYGMIYQNNETKKYNLGPLSYRLGASEISQKIQSFVSLSKTHVDNLRDTLSETISLELWMGNKTTACYMAESRRPLQVSMPLGNVLPLHAPAGAKAVLSFVNQDYLDRLLTEDFPQYTDNTITTKTKLLAKLSEFNRQGYSIDDQELHMGIYAIGVPIFDYISKPVAAISAILPSARINAGREAEIVAQLKRTSHIISQKIKRDRTGFYYHLGAI
jgi:DNA-binding IclR family transcriptional regulator